MASKPETGAVASLHEVIDDLRLSEARDIRAALFAQCRSLLSELGDDVSGFALVAWTRQGELRSAFDTGYGPLRPLSYRHLSVMR